MNQSSSICAYLYDLAKSRNGENVTVQLNDVDVFIVQRLEEADRVLRLNAANYRKNMAWFKQTLGASRFSEDGRAWEIRRALTQSYFNKFDREQTFKLATHYALTALEDLIPDSCTSGHMNDNTLRAMTASVLVDNFFGVELDKTGIDLGLLAQLMEYGSEYSFVPPGKTFHLYKQTLVLLPELRRRVLAQLGYFRSIDMPRSDLLDDLVAADTRKEDRVRLEQELMTFMAAGAETSAATMGWVGYLLALHPDMQERLREIAQAFWRKDTPSWRQLSKLQPLAAFISEALRLYPPTPIVARFAIESDQLGETAIDAGQNVLISFIGIQHDERYRNAPWSLNIDHEINSKVAGDTIAFGFGPRICGGKNFALVELITFLSVFLNRARFTLTSDAPPVFHWKSQMLREGGQPVRVEWLDDDHQ